jgi:hypothetical protein
MFDKIINFIESEWYRPVIVVFAMVLVLIFTILLGLEREEKRLLLQEQSWKQQGYKIGE